MDYHYKFPDFTDNNEVLEAFHQHSNKTYFVNLHVKDADLLKTNSAYLTSILADFVDLAVAVYVADWLSARRGDKVLDIEVKLPLRNPDTFSECSNLDALQKILFWYTGDHWHFDFHLRKKVGRQSEVPCVQSAFSFMNQYATDEVALWSGGLDSLAGLFGRLASQPEKRFTLVGTGTNTQVQGKQAEIASSLYSRYPEQIKLIQIPINLGYLQDRPATNDAFRVRGFTFKLLGAVCALLERVNSLSIYENGYGAINLPFTLSETGTSHTRSVHPLSLIQTGQFVSKLQSVNFRFDNPYLFSTKAQMCRTVSKFSDIAFNTWSCDGRCRIANQSMQCGHCSSCLLRRMSLLNAFGFDKTGYVNVIDSSEEKRASHFTAMRLQAIKLEDAFKANDPWEALSERYVCLRQISGHMSKEWNMTESSIQSQLLQIYRNHVNEWKYAEPWLEKSLLGEQS